MGSSAGGHLAALTSTYREPIAGEGVDDVDKIDCLPDAAILCYPVTTLCEEHRHKKTASNLLGEKESELAAALSPDRIADKKTPPTFIWHTANDELVPVLNSLRYAERLYLHLGTFPAPTLPSFRILSSSSFIASPREEK